MRNRQSIYSFARVLVAGALALAFVAGLALLLSSRDVRAKQAMDSAGADAVAAPAVLTPTSQTRKPENGALIEEDGPFLIEGVAWLGDNPPPSSGDTAESETAPATLASRGLAAGESITVRVRIDDGDWQTATVTDTEIVGWDGWDWSYEWSLPEDERYQKHAIHTWASAEGTLGPTHTITVTVNNRPYYLYLPIIANRWPPVPRKPAIEEIDNADGDDSYEVHWSYDDTPEVDTYILQEATQSSFADAVEYELDSDETSKSFSDKGRETYYYRVKGRNSYGDGPWSAVRSVTSASPDLDDDFSDPDSGWRTHDASCCLDGCDRGDLQAHPEYKYNLFYEDGKYHVKIPLDCRAGGNHGDTRHIYPVVFAPDVERPDARTCIEAKGKFERWDPYWSFWGLVFAASDDKSTVWSLEVNNLGNWGVVKRTGYDFPGPNAPWENENRSYEVNYGGGARAAFESNTLRAEIEGNSVKLYVNGKKVHEFSNSEIGSLENVGLIGGDWEITPTQIGYDHFYLDEGCDDH